MSEPGTAQTAPALTAPPEEARQMSILRVERRARYTTIDRRTLRDDRLSFRALGLLAHLLSQADGWPINSAEMARRRPEGRDAIRAAMRELIEAGYVSRKREQVEKGRWAMVTTVREVPPGTGFQASDNPTLEAVTEDGLPGVGAPGDKSNTPEELPPTVGEPVGSFPVQECVAYLTDVWKRTHDVVPPKRYRAAYGAKFKEAFGDGATVGEIKKAINRCALESKTPAAFIGVLQDYYRDRKQGVA